MVNFKENEELKTNILNMHVAIIDKDKALLGEIEELNGKKAKIRMLGEFINGKFNGGVIRKPLLDAQIRSLLPEELPAILGINQKNSLLVGGSPYYQESPIYIDVNQFLGHHFAIFGNSGSGKSCGLARLIQNIFSKISTFIIKFKIVFRLIYSDL